jgi:hypothetical protein
VFAAGGFTRVVHQVVIQITAADWPSFIEKSALRADSFLVRLMAEEVRADADEMSCTSAKEMMGSVAATYDRLAENLERRLGSGSDRVTSVLG